MFHFSALLSKAEADAARTRKSRPAEPPQPDQEPSSASDCVSDRVRRDLDEQMQRLKELLDRVETLEFEQEAATAEILSTPSAAAAQAGSSPTPESAPLHQNARTDAPRDEHSTLPIAAAREHGTGSDTPPSVSHATNCEIVLGDGIRSRPDDLACQSPVVAEKSMRPAVESTTPKSARTRGCPSSSTPCRQTPAKPPGAASPGVVQEFSVAPSPSAERAETGAEFPPSSPDVAGGYGTEDRAELELITPVVAVRYAGDPDFGTNGTPQMVLVDQTIGGGVPVTPTAPERTTDRNPSQLTHRSKNLDLPRVRCRFTPSDRLSPDPSAPAHTQRGYGNERGSSRTLSLLAACGGLLILGTLVYLLDDLVSWFRSWQM